MRKLWWLVCALVLMTACSQGVTRLRVAGSTSVQPLAEVLAEAYTRSGGGPVSIQGGGSTAGLQAVLRGIATLGAVSRPLTPAESDQGLVEHIIGYDILTIVVHPANPVTNITREQLVEIFSGRVSDWRQVGGRPGLIHLVTREAGSGSREAFRSLVGGISPRAIVQNSSGAIRVAILDNPQAIGYVSLGVARMGGLKLLAVAGQNPGEPQYPLIRPLSFVTLGQANGEAEAFLRFATSQAGQRLLAEEGLVPVR